MSDIASDEDSLSTELEIEQLKAKLKHISQEGQNNPPSILEFPSSDEDSVNSSVETEQVDGGSSTSSAVRKTNPVIQLPTTMKEPQHTPNAASGALCLDAARAVRGSTNSSATMAKEETARYTMIQGVPRENPYLVSKKQPLLVSEEHRENVATLRIQQTVGPCWTKTSDSSSPSSSPSSSSSSLSGSSSSDVSSSSSDADESSSMDVQETFTSISTMKRDSLLPTHKPSSKAIVSRTDFQSRTSATAATLVASQLIDGEDCFVGDDESEKVQEVPHYSFPALQIKQAPPKNITPSPVEVKKLRTSRALEQVESSLTDGAMARSLSKENPHGTTTLPLFSRITKKTPSRDRPNAVIDSDIIAPFQDVAQYHWPTQGFNQHAEIDRSLYVPPLYQPTSQPVLHRFHETNRPKHTRQQIPVAKLFHSPVSLLWRGKFDRFNALQSELAERLCHTSDDMVVSAPTGAGKTALFEMAIGRFICEDLQHSNDPSRLSKHRKIVYIAPSKALSEERYHDWTKRLAALNLGIEVAMITGENNDQGGWHQDLSSAHMILTTPEKWDSITRKWTDNFFVLASVKLLLVDEVHLLGDESRGSCLEAILSRMKSIQRAATSVNASQDQVRRSSYALTTPAAIASAPRTIAVSATLPNIVDVAEFIGALDAFTFDSSFRPVPLLIDVHACGFLGKNEYRFWESLEAQVPPIIQRFAENKQTLIFCHTKKDTEKLCKTLIDRGVGNPNKVATSAMEGGVEYNLRHRVAFHHAGMPPEDKARVEKAFASGEIRCLCATSTLAVGVNLPAHLVIIKGTRAWRGTGNGYQDIDKQSLLQMIGRAGRPGLDTSGRAIIMTDNNSKSLMESRIQGLGPAESRLLGKLKDVLATEIAQGVVTNIDTAIAWFKTTFLFVRLRQNPSKYAMDISWRTIDDYIIHLLQTALECLASAKMIEFQHSKTISATPGCHIMSQRMVSFESMRSIASLPHDATRYQILVMLSKMEVFSSHVFRNEKKELNECHKGPCVKYHLDGPKNKARIQEPWEKAFVLLQAFIGGHRFESFALRHQMTTFGDAAIRLLEAAEEYSTKASRHGYVAVQCEKLRRCLHFSLWGEDDGLLQQVNGMSHEVAARLKIAGISTFDQVTHATADEIECATGRPSPFGLQVKTWVSTVLQSRLKLSAAITFTTGANLAADVTCQLTFANPTEAILSGSKKTELSYVMFAYTDQPGSCTLCRDNISGPMAFNFSPPPRFGKLFIVLIASIIGLDEILVLDGNLPAISSSFLKAPKGQNRTLKNKKSVAENLQLSVKQMTPPHENQQNIHGRSKDHFRRQQPRKTKDAEPRPQAPVGRISEKPTLTPVSPCRSSSQRVIYTLCESTDESARFSNLKQPKPIGGQRAMQNEQYQWNSRQYDISNPASFEGLEKTGSMRKQAFSQRAQQIIHETQVPTPIIFSQNEATLSPAALLVQDKQPQRYMCNEHGSNGIRKREQAPGAWQTDKKKQQRTQQRAFASKSDNPFSSFQHDPNDAESFLDGLAQADHHHIIPPRELRRFDEITHARCGNHEPSRFCSSARRRRQPPGPGQTPSNYDILRMKAEEANAYTNAFTHPNIRSPFYDVPASTRRTPARNGNVTHAEPAYPLTQGEQMSIYSDRTLSYQTRSTGPEGTIQYNEFPFIPHHEIYSPFGAACVDRNAKGYHCEQQDGGGWSAAIPAPSQFAHVGRMQVERSDGVEPWTELHSTEGLQYDFSFLGEDIHLYP